MLGAVAWTQQAFEHCGTALVALVQGLAAAFQRRQGAEANRGLRWTALIGCKVPKA